MQRQFQGKEWRKERYTFSVTPPMPLGPQKLPLSLSLAHSCNINQARRRRREEEEGRERAALLTIKGPRSTRSVGRPGGLYGRHRAPTQEKSQARQVDQPLHIEPFPHELLLSLQGVSIPLSPMLCLFCTAHSEDSL